MRLSLRFIVPLLGALALFAWLLVPFADRFTQGWFERDVDMRSVLVANTAQDPLAELLKGGSPERAVQFFTRLTRDERLQAVGYCQTSASRMLATATMPPGITCENIRRFADVGAREIRSPQGATLRVTPVEMPADASVAGT